MTSPGPFRRIYGAPLWLAAAGCLGLGAGLFGDGLWDWVSWLALGGMTGVGLRHALGLGLTSGATCQCPEAERKG